MKNVIEVKSIRKGYEHFTLAVENLNIPCGFTTVVVGENGSGKTTFLRIIGGLDHDYTGTFNIFDEEDVHDVKANVKKKIAFGASKNYYMDRWNVEQISNISELIFEDFDSKKFVSLCNELQVGGNEYSITKSKKVMELSDGNLVKLILANVFARTKTELVILDEPSGPLDPVMKDVMKDKVQDYVASGNGNRTVIISTHDVNDIEVIADYVVIVDDGRIKDAGFVEELKESYVVVKGDKLVLDDVKEKLISYRENAFGFEGMAKKEDVESLNQYDLVMETPSLNEIVVNIIKSHKKV